MADAQTTAEAIQKAHDDAQMFGVGFLMLTLDGLSHVPPEAVSIDGSKMVEAQRGRE